MNEMDLKTKIEGLKKAIAEHNDFAGTYTSDLAKAEQQLKDLGKIALPPVVFDDIYEAVEMLVESLILVIQIILISNMVLNMMVKYTVKVMI